MHRAVAPPGEQAKYPRQFCVYFSRPNGHVVLKALIGEAEEDGNMMTVDEMSALHIGRCLETRLSTRGPKP